MDEFQPSTQQDVSKNCLYLLNNMIQISGFQFRHTQSLNEPLTGAFIPKFGRKASKLKANVQQLCFTVH